MATLAFSKRQRRKQTNPSDDAVLDDCCSFLHLGALVVSDMLFNDGNIDVDSKGNVIPSLKHRVLQGQPYMITVDKRHDTEETMVDDDDDGYTAITLTTFQDRDGATMVVEDDDEYDDHTADRSECENTLTDISAIIASRLTCSPRSRRHPRDDNICRSTSTFVSDEEGLGSNILPSATVPSLFDEMEEDAGDQEQQQDEAQKDVARYSARTSRKYQQHHRNRKSQKDRENVPSIIIPQRRNNEKPRGPHQLQRLVSRGLRLNPASSSAGSNYHDTSNSNAMKVCSATSKGKHFKKTAILARNERSIAMNEMAPFDEPLWYH
ncbi:hypothetical protein IV203_018662 [Nitzschia inconspicua]|uniref:Uncharacterized protein n=1 Tax=Nitzschia inconspicua TaxID=303405 RepID=A0A9K3M2G6_9STRA|nr:hypothetical protein IV203_018662 [Nitzschia inconspicua]